MNTKLNTLKGFRDYLPKDKSKREYIVGIIKDVFEKFGFEQIQTPTLEYAEVILGKYGEEADKLVYKFKDLGGREVALPYDLTVPTARILAQYKQLPKYFRRYQIQNVFRADKPQKGRYREFTQCDIDIFGSKDPIADAEIIACAYFAYEAIGFPNISILANDRKTLSEIVNNFATKKVNPSTITQSIDKLDKKSESEVIKELIQKGLNKKSAKSVLVKIKGSKPSKNLEVIINNSVKLGVDKNAIKYSPTLARGLDYYTGLIFEVKLPDYDAGSVGGGGRYDDLIEKLSGVDIPAVGFSIGLDRIVEVAEKLKLYPEELTSVQVLVTIFNPKFTDSSIKIANLLRKSNIKCEIFPDENVKLNKQLKYADKKGVSWVVIIGPNEAVKDEVVLKNLKTKRQQSISTSALLAQIK